MKKLEHDALRADRAAIEELLATIPDDDVLGRTSLEARLREVDGQLSEAENELDTEGSVALMFGGGPVLGSYSIDADFASKALRSFHSLVRKKVTLDETGSLGRRGPVAHDGNVRLGITELVRGSMGFLLEESSPNLELTDSVVKKALDDVTDLVVRTAAESPTEFESAVESIDSRMLVSLQKFFRTLDDNRATLRIVENQRDATLDSKAVERGRSRVDATEIRESQSESVVGELLGLLPGARRFEMRLSGSGEIIRGTVATTYAATYLELIEQPGDVPVGRHWRAKMRVREIRERNKPPRTLYTLIGLLEQVRAIPRR